MLWSLLQREAESKYKLLEKKCDKRLLVSVSLCASHVFEVNMCFHATCQLTRKAGDWIPRLERMVVSRGLCPFEKNVLITLIGFVIQPNKVVV